MEQIGLEAILDLGKFDDGIKRYLSGLNRMDDANAGMSSKFSKGFDQMGQGVLKVAGLLSGALVAGAVAATAAMGAFVVSGIKKAGDLEAQMGAIAAVMGETKDAVGPLKDLILDLGLDPTLKVNAQQAADAIEKLASNGLNMTQIMEGAAKATVLLANSTDADFGTAAAIATDAMALFNIKAADMMEAVNGITGVTVSSKFDINDYRLALAQAGGVASATGVSFDDFNTSITGMANLFASGSDAGTSFKTMLLRLVPSTNKAAEAMGDLGLMTTNTQVAVDYLASQGVVPVTKNLDELRQLTMDTFAAANGLAAGSDEATEAFGKWATATGFVQSAFYDANGQMKDMDEISAVLNDALSDLSEEEKSKALNTIFGTDAMRAAVGLAEQGEIAYTDQALAAKELGVSYDSLTEAMEGGLTKFEALSIQLGNTDAAAAAKVRMDNFKGSLEILQGAIETVSLKIGFAFLPMLKEMADRISEFVSAHADQIVGFFENLSLAIQAFVSGTPGDFPWEDIFPEWLANRMYDISAMFEAINTVILDFQSGALGADYPWEDVFPAWLANTIYFVTENIDAFKGALGGVAALLASAGIAAAISAIGAAMAAVLSPIGLMIIAAGALGAAWNTNFLGLRDTTLAVINAVVTAFEPLTTAISEFGSGALAEIVAFATGNETQFTNIKAIWAGAVESVTGVFNSIVASVASALPDWIAALQDWGAKVGTTLLSVDYQAIGTSILTAIKDGWSATVATVLPVISAFATSIGDKFKETDWKKIGSDILTAIKDGWEAVKGATVTSISAIATSLKDRFGDTVNNWTQAGKDILSKVSEGINAQKTAALTSIAAVVTAMRERYVTPEGFAWSTVGADIATAIKTGLESAARAVGGILSAAAEIATAIKDQFTDLTWNEIGQLIIDGIKAGLVAAANAASGLLATVKTVGLDMMKAFTEINWEEVGRNIARLLKDGFKALVEGVGGLLPTAKGAANSVGSAFSDIDWLALGSAIVTAIGAGVKTVAYAAGGLISIVADIAIGMTEELFGVEWDTQGSDIVAYIGDGVSNAANTLYNKVRELTAGIKKIFTDLASSWTGIGTDIVAGIKKGFDDAWEGMVDAVKAAADLLPQFVKDALGISSPSKVFMEIGRNIVEGLIVGIDEKTAALRAAADRITSTISLKDLLTVEFTPTHAFTDLLNESYVEPLKTMVDAIDKRRKELQGWIVAIQRDLATNIPADRRNTLLGWLAQANAELANLNSNQQPQQLATLLPLLARNSQLQNNIAFTEQQIALMKEAKKLGISTADFRLGDQSVENLIRMAAVEKRIAELKSIQLFLEAESLRNTTDMVDVYADLRQSIDSYTGSNSFLKNQLSMLKQAVELGLDLKTITGGNLLGNPNDVGATLRLTQQIEMATNRALQNEIMQLQAQENRAVGLAAAMKQLQPIIDQTNVSSVFGQRYKATVLDPILAALEQAAGIDSERVRLMNQYTQAAQKLVEIQKKEQNLDFLQQQLDLVTMIRDQDIPGGDSLFAGLQFGINASIDDLTALTSRVLDGMIKQVKDQLGIHSPSAVFAKIGGQMMQGMAQGIQTSVAGPLSALRQSTVAHGAMSSRTLNFAMGGVTINSGMDEIMFESRVLRILERSMN